MELVGSDERNFIREDTGTCKHSYARRYRNHQTTCSYVVALHKVPSHDVAWSHHHNTTTCTDAYMCRSTRILKDATIHMFVALTEQYHVALHV